MSSDSPSAVRHTEAAREFEPTAHYAALRENCPVHRAVEHDPPFYVVSRYDDVHDVLRHPDLWRNGDGPGVFYQPSGVLGTADDPDHARQRTVLRAAFTPGQIARLEPRIMALTDDLIDGFTDGFIDEGECDFVERFAEPLPALAIAELLGVDGDQRGEFQRWSNLAVAALTGGDVDAYAEAKQALEDVIAAGVTARFHQLDDAATAPDDVMTMLAAAWRDGTIDEREMRHLGYQLLVAGHETTTSLLGMMLYRLLEHPALMAALRADPSLIPDAVEEALRFDSPVHGLFRTNATECKLLGETIPERTKLQVVYASANRDPSRFTDPDTFRLDRDTTELRQHVAFGFGIHFCLGAPLARLECRVAFTRLLERLADIELAGPPIRNDSFVLHGLTSLPIRFRSAA